MAIRFACSACGAGFEVEPGLAGRRARCRRCGGTMTVPAPAARATIEPRPAPAAPPRATTWIDAVNSRVGLVPLSAESLRPAALKPSPLDDASGSALYALAPDTAPRAPLGFDGRPAGPVVVGYRRNLLMVQRSFRRLNEAANLIAIPFLGAFLMGIILHSRPLCLVAATVAVLLNASRLATGLANLLVIPFRDGPLRGLLFLVPPLTLLYLARNWSRARGPVGRIAGPAATIGLVVLAFALVPWLGGAPADAPPVERLRAGETALRDGIESELERAGAAVPAAIPDLPGTSR